MKMRLDTKDIIKQKLLDTQENVRDFQQYAKDVKDHETICVFKQFAEDEALHAQKLQEILDRLET
jgi:rubrerythrin